MKSLTASENEGEGIVYSLLEYIASLPAKTTPRCYIDILYEVAKNTPIV